MKTPKKSSLFQFLAILATGTLLVAPGVSRADDDEPKALIAILMPTEGSKVTGTVTFTEIGDDKVKVEAHVEGLEPNSKHGFHVHEFGDLSSPDGSAAGSHFNPEKHDHALPTTEVRHVGDLGNLEANDQGVAHYTITVDNMSLTDDDNAIIGRGLIVHEKADDGSQPVGNAGARIAQGVIGVKNPGKK